MIRSTEPVLRPDLRDDTTPDFVAIRGWTISLYTTLPGLGLVPNGREEYGNSPIRDRRALSDRVAELFAQGHHFSVTPILETKSR